MKITAERMDHLSYLACLVTATCMQFSGALLTNKGVCYEPLGCFSNDYPFIDPLHRPELFLPQSPEKIKTRFILYTRASKRPQYLDAVNSRDALTVLTNFQPRPTKFIIHGFMDNVILAPWMKEMKDELLKYGDYNVFIVDWSGGNLPPYGRATSNTRVVGAQVAYLVNLLIATANITAANVHIIGHSLGAHTAGYAGEKILGCGRISGLDPAGPLFEKTAKEVRLDPSDALFVDVIHTDMHSGLKLNYGTKDPSGHVDFYPNGGYDQPGCKLLSSTTEAVITKGFDEITACSHIRSHQYYAESINSDCLFTAYQCDNELEFKLKKCINCVTRRCSRMGFHADEYKPPRGKTFSYFLKTESKSPFCIVNNPGGFLTG